MASILTAQQQIPSTTLNIQTALAAAASGGSELLHSPSNPTSTNQITQQQLHNLPSDLLYQAALLAATQLG